MIKLFELFAGYGSQSLALQRLGIEFENVGYCEIDKYAIQAHKALHGEDIPNFGDITKVDAESLPDMDLLTYSFPCQDISVAGKGRGLSKDSGTRSSLLWECHKIIAAKRPKYLMMENVKNLVGKKNLPDFQSWINELRELGYNNYYKVINAKDCGVPQNRERVFCISIRRDSDEGTFRFNEPFDNGVRLKDLLEDEVDEKFYIADEKVEKLISQLKNGIKGTLPNKEYQTSSALSSREHRGQGWRETVGTLCARDYKDPKVVAVPCLTPDRLEKRQNGRRFKEDGEPMFTLTGQDRHGVLVIDDTQGFDGVRTYENESPCLRSERSGLKVLLDIPREIINDNKRQRRVYSTDGTAPAVLARQDSAKILQVGSLEMKGSEQVRRVYHADVLCPTIDTMQGGHRQPKVLDGYRIRKLTPKECFRLMGLTDEEIKKIQDAGISNSQQYKMAGNSIVVDQMFFLKNLF